MTGFLGQPCNTNHRPHAGQQVGADARPDWSVDEERAGELHEVEGRRQLAPFAVQVGLHVGQAVVGLLLGQVLQERGGRLDLLGTLVQTGARTPARTWYSSSLVT